MKVLTSISIIVTPEGKKLSYTYSEIDAGGVVTRANVRESYIATETQLLNMISNLESKIINDKNIK